MATFKIGEVVRLKSGGPPMTIQRIIGGPKLHVLATTGDEAYKVQGFRDGDVVCQWFEGGARLTSAAFAQDSPVSAQQEGRDASR